MHPSAVEVPPLSARSTSYFVKRLLVFGLLLAGVYLIFSQTMRYWFIGCDDPDYVYQNPYVSRGLTFRGVLWAFFRSHSYNWHPLTWLSHMTDCQCFGLAAGWHHVVNFLLHGISACLLFVLLRRLSEWDVDRGPWAVGRFTPHASRLTPHAFWPPAFVAALFAIHPLHVESVAWISERKDILAGMFFFLTLLAYESYVRHGLSTWRYVLTSVLFILGLMAKPMLVTLPLVALLLDYWPLGRFRRDDCGKGDSPHLPERPGGCFAQMGTVPFSAPDDKEPSEEDPPGRIPPWLPPVMEKVPWLALSGVACAITILAQTRAIQPFDYLPIGLRLGNAVMSYAAYLGQALWPAKLCAFYPHLEKMPPLASLCGAVALLAAISLLAVWLRASHPYLLVGWLWYLGMLVPVIGIVQVGGQAMADRYSYLPHIGLYIALAWTAGNLTRNRPRFRALIAAAATLALAALLVTSWAQTTFWRNDLAIWTRARSCTPENAVTLNNIAVATERSGRNDEARAMLDYVIKNWPDYALAYYNRSGLLDQERKYAEAVADLEEALKLSPDERETENELARLLAKVHRQREAIVHMKHLLTVDPNAVPVMENLAWVLATTDPADGGDPQQALALAQRICGLLPSPGSFELDLLAAAYASAGHYPEAVAAANRAAELATAAGRPDLVDKIRAREELYRAQKPYRD